jgi:hypothetical protein
MRYLWVDALCIKQGNDMDFANEVARMGSIYAQSVFTIAAADSKDSVSGCFRDRQPLGKEKCHIWENKSYAILFSPDPGIYEPHRHLTDGFLDTRAWVYQERMMSPRTIHFCQDEYVWECRKWAVCQDCTPIIGQHNKLSTGPKALFVASQQLARSKSPLSDFQRIWIESLSNYGRAMLSNNDDRLSALAGVVQLMRQQFNYQASFGLWLDFFIEELLWKVIPPSTVTVQYHSSTENVPSWSWLGIQGCIFGSNVSIDQQRHVAKILQSPPATPFTQISTLLKQVTQPRSLKLLGWLASGWPMPLHTFYDWNWSLVPATTKFSDNLNAYKHVAWEAYLKNAAVQGRDLGRSELHLLMQLRFFPDRAPQSPHPLTCVLLKSKISSSQAKPTTPTFIDLGLVLERVGSTGHMFRRIGTFEESVWVNKRHVLTSDDPELEYKELRNHMTMFPGMEHEEVEIEII